jgi:hypothetical protein
VCWTVSGHTTESPHSLCLTAPSKTLQDNLSQLRPRRFSGTSRSIAQNSFYRLAQAVEPSHNQ